MRDYGHNPIARRDRGECDRDGDPLESEDVTERSKNVDREADYRERVEELRDDRCRYVCRRLQRDLSSDAEQDRCCEARIIECYPAHALSRRKTGGRLSVVSKSSLRRTSF